MERLPKDSLGRTQSISDQSRAAARPESCYLIVFTGGTSKLHPLPMDGEIVVGRAPDAGLCLDHKSVSRHHVRLTLSDGQTTLTDLGSRNGTQVNGVRIAAPCLLLSGDVIGIGELTLVFQRSGRVLTRRALLDSDEIRRRLVEEIEREQHYDRPLSLVHFSSGGRSLEKGGRWEEVLLGRLRPVDIAARAGDDGLLVVMPELPADRVREATSEILKALEAVMPGIRAGIASCPYDGSDADALLAGARAAAAVAEPGKVTAAAAAATVIEVGEHTVIAAEPAVVRVFALIARLAPSDLPILIYGETGAGKELAAAAVHHGSARSRQPFVAINCAAIPDTLVESELFGYEKGAFSGANAAKPGLLEGAAGGTVFLDELGELSLPAQAKLLRVLETKRVSRLGAQRERAIDVRLVGATNRDLQAEIAAGRFRQDLFFRLGVAAVVLPPLRDRPRDLPILARAFLDRACARAGRQPPALSPATLHVLLAHRWPGNVRELKNLMEYLAVAVREKVIDPQMLPANIAGAAAAPPPASPSPPPVGAHPVGRFAAIGDEIRDLERGRMVAALEATGGNQSRAAELIGMPRRTFVSKLREYRIAPGR